MAHVTPASLVAATPLGGGASSRLTGVTTGRPPFSSVSKPTAPIGPTVATKQAIPI